MRRPVVLAILDGWGIGEASDCNAIALAKTPNLDRYAATYPQTSLGASGSDVGLIAGQMGNSNVGHLNIGAGRIVYQDLGRITRAVETGEFDRNPALLAAMDRLKGGGTLHLMGLLSDGGVHSHEDHVFALVRLAKARGISDVCLHLFLDGRDVPPKSALTYIERLERVLAEVGIGRIATVQGRYYAMDRDKRWERVERAWAALVRGEGNSADSPATAVRQAYAHDESDEFVMPTVILNPDGTPRARIRSGDSLIFWDFRADRARELSHALVDPQFTGFPRPDHPDVHYVTLTCYEHGLPVAGVAFPPEPPMRNILGDWLAQHGVRQLRIAETEKYAHVTYFFNGGLEEPFPGEERVLVPSPKVATYDQTPAMSAREITDQLLQRLRGGTVDFVALNYANCDMVGHTGDLKATIAAVEIVDRELGRIADEVLAQGGALLVISDHGNAELMRELNGEPHTAHTANRVPCLLIDERRRGVSLCTGVLADVAPTLLELLELPVPPEMTGRSIIIHSGEE